MMMVMIIISEAAVNNVSISAGVYNMYQVLLYNSDRVSMCAYQTKGCDAAIMMKGFCQTGAATDKHRTDGGQTMRTPAATRI